MKKTRLSIGIYLTSDKMIKLKSKDKGEFVEVVTESGEKISCADVIVTWDPQFGLLAKLTVINPEIDLEIKEGNVEVVKKRGK